jgi:hypothetical protein
MAFVTPRDPSRFGDVTIVECAVGEAGIVEAFFKNSRDFYIVIPKLSDQPKKAETLLLLIIGSVHKIRTQKGGRGQQFVTNLKNLYSFCSPPPPS